MDVRYAGTLSGVRRPALEFPRHLHLTLAGNSCPRMHARSDQNLENLILPYAASLCGIAHVGKARNAGSRGGLLLRLL